MFKLMSFATLTLLCCLPCGNAQSSPQTLTGQEWLERLPEVVKNAYTSGYSVGYQVAALTVQLALKAPPSESKRIFDALKSHHDCLHKMTAGQKTAIVDKAVREHPETWDEGIDFFVQNALWKACASREGK